MSDKSVSSQTPMGVVGRVILGVYLMILSGLLIYVLLAFWLSALPAPQGATTAMLFGKTVAISADLQQIILIAVVAALGSNIHAATSFADFAGNQRLYRNWVWWYLLRVFIGVSLALIFYFTIRGGFLAAGSSSGQVNMFGMVAVAGLVGMFSKQATDKLRELFDTLFKTEKANDRLDKLANQIPLITDLEPSRFTAGATDVSLTIHGNGFVRQAVVRFGGVDQPTTFIGDTQLTVAVPNSAIAKPGEIEVSVFNPPPGGGSSNVARAEIAR